MSTPKHRKNKSKSPSRHKPLIDIPEEEKWRLIRESGLLERFKPEGAGLATPASTPVPTPAKTDEPVSLAEEIFNAMMIIIPHTFFLVMMDILIHHQYAKHPTLNDILYRLMNTFPIMAVFMFYIIRHKNKTMVQIGLLLLSLGVGPRMIWLVNRGSWLKNIAQCPQFATIWLFTVVQLQLSYAFVSLCLIGGWSWWSGMKLLL